MCRGKILFSFLFLLCSPYQMFLFQVLTPRGYTLETLVNLKNLRSFSSQYPCMAIYKGEMMVDTRSLDIHFVKTRFFMGHYSLVPTLTVPLMYRDFSLRPTGFTLLSFYFKEKNVWKIYFYWKPTPFNFQSNIVCVTYVNDKTISHYVSGTQGSQELLVSSERLWCTTHVGNTSWDCVSFHPYIWHPFTRSFSSFRNFSFLTPLRPKPTFN